MATNTDTCNARTTTVASLAPGQIVFCARPSAIQTCSERVGDEWRHAGVVVETPDGLSIAGFGRRDKYALMPLEALANYSRVAVGTVFGTPQEVEALQRWVHQFGDGGGAYPSSSIPIAWVLSWARTRSRSSRAVLTRLCGWYCAWLALRYRRRVAFICSTFVYAAVNAARDQPLELPMSGPKSEPSCSRPVATREIRLARWLATPTDLWRAIPPTQRADVLVAG